MDKKYVVPYAASAPTKGIRLTGGRLEKAFRNNIAFLRGFDTDRILYYYRVHKGKPAPGVPYCWQSGHFERNLKGQTAGEFLMGACTTLLWEEDETLRGMAEEIVKEIAACRDADGFFLPIDRNEWRTKEYPNYTRAWVTYGLLDAGYAGIGGAFDLARGMTDFFNSCDLLDTVKDMNLGFQGLLIGTRVYDSPVGKTEDIDVTVRAYEERWWLGQCIAGDHKAIYAHPGNHPHSTLLTTLEGYLDLYRVTGDETYLRAVKGALKMYEDKWQHVGGGINMCEMDTYYPGCSWLSMKHNYNELCSTNFWIFLNQRMRLLEPDNSHYADEIENSVYNVLLASQVGSEGYHYLNFLEGGKDSRYLDRCTCCASLGTRLAGMLPQFLYTTAKDVLYADLYAASEADLDLNGNAVSVVCRTAMPDDGGVTFTVTRAEKPFSFKFRIPRWVTAPVTLMKNGKKALTAGPGYAELTGIKAGDEIAFTLPMGFRVTKYTGGETIPDKDRFALEYGPLLYAALGPATVEVAWDPAHPENEFVPIPGSKRRFAMRHDGSHEYMAYLDIHDEPFSVYPIVQSTGFTDIGDE